MSGSLGSATDLMEWAILSHTLGISPFTMPPALFVGLCTTRPSDIVGGTELVGGSYARQMVTFVMQTPTPSDRAFNAASVEWPPATVAFQGVGWWELWSSIMGGQRYYWGTLVDPADNVTPITRNIAVGDILRISAGSLVVTAD
jgi:hypothetical protein